jgi:hypothetical protein
MGDYQMSKKPTKADPYVVEKKTLDKGTGNESVRWFVNFGDDGALVSTFGAEEVAEDFAWMMNSMHLERKDSGEHW